VLLFLFILVNAAIFIRPAELAPELAAVPIYLILILLCFVLSLPKILMDLLKEPITTRPISVCMLGLLLAVVLSNLSKGDLTKANSDGTEFSKVVMFYFLLVGLVDTPARLRTFLIALLVLISIMTTIALLQYQGVINLPTLQVLERKEFDSNLGEDVIYFQLVGTGIFNDPNDLCVILTLGIVIGLYLFSERRYRVFRVTFLVLAMELAYALSRTQSRGGLLACMASVLMVMALRIGMKKTMILAFFGLPVVLAALGGRLARMSTGEDTAKQRLDLWREALLLFRKSPLFGNGSNTLVDEIGLVAHNSYVHAFAELGFFGGTLFVGIYFLAFYSLFRLGRDESVAVDPELRSMRPYVIAMVVGYVVSLYSISRIYGNTPYVAVGLAEIYSRVSTIDSPESRLKLNGRILAKMLGASVGFLIFIHLFLRVA
jgi:putative inorganic carbon (HCO3(-)) transporter